MKKVYFIAIALVIAMMAASCTGSPKSKGDSPAPAAPVSVAPPPKPVDEFPPEEADEADIEDDEIAGIDIEDADWEDSEFEEPVLAEEEPPAEDELLTEEPPFEEPPPPAVAAAPEPPPPPPPPPPPEPPPPAAPRPATPPPTVTARPTPAPAAPRPATPPQVPPPAATPAPPAEAPPAAAQEPPPAVTPPAAGRESASRDIPELPNPTPAFRGRPDDEVVFSRVVRATAGQLVMVPFRGTGWVYLGEIGSRKGIVYDSRRLDPEGQSFIFRTEAPGEYALKFYRQDFIRDFILNDYVQVIVGDPPETVSGGWNSLIDRGRVIAEPRWPTSLEEAQALRGNIQPSRPDVAAAPAAPAEPVRPPAQPPAQTPPAQPQTPPAQTAPQPPRAQTPPTPVQPPPPQPVPAEPPPPEPEPPVSILELEPDEYLQKAKEEFEAGRIAPAIAYLDRFHEHYPVDSDEVLWLYGQFYEANSPSRNILAALDCYRRLTREYPQSSRFDDARRRIAYLQRYYINIQ